MDMVRKTQGLMIMDNNLLGNFKPKRWFEEIKINQTLDPVYKIATKQQLVMYAGASRDFVPIHYDYQVAQNAGHDQVIIHGALKTAWLSQFVSQWAGLNSFILELEVQYRAIDFPGEKLICNGKVAKKTLGEFYGIVDIEINLEKENGQISVPGKAKLAIPSKEKILE
jgi:acyl dehydratase